MEQFIMEYLLEIILALIGGLLALAQYRARLHHAREIDRLQTEAEARKRESDERNNRHALEIQALKGESDQQRMQLEIIRESNAGTFKERESWQRVINTMSERKHEDNERLSKSLDGFTLASRNLTEMIEIHSEQLRQLGEIVENSDKRSLAATQQLDTIGRENRADLTTALGISVSERAAHESSLRIIQQSIHDLRTAVNHTLTQNEQQKSQMLTVIDVRFKELERAIMDMITPQPLSASPPTTQPIPELWDDDDNPSLDKTA